MYDNNYVFLAGGSGGVIGSIESSPSPGGCPMGMFRCPEGKCIPASWVCNYQRDCENAEDEFQSCREYYY